MKRLGIVAGGLLALAVLALLQERVGTAPDEVAPDPERPAAVSAYFAPDSGRLVLRDRAAAAFLDAGRVAISLAGSWGLHWGPVGAARIAAEPRDAGSARIHRLVGPRERWSSGLPSYGSAVYAGIRPGVDLALRPAGSGLKYDLHLAAGSDVRELVLAYEGALELRVSADGAAIEVVTGVGVVRESGLACFQDGRSLPVRYVARGGASYGFEVDGYDPSRPLHVDPVIAWSSLHGGSHRPGQFASDEAKAVAVDGSGAVYVTGWTHASDFPTTPGALDRGLTGLWGNSDAFVTKFAANGSGPVWSTYLGGSLLEVGNAIAVDASGSVYVAGSTNSSDHPLVGAFLGPATVGDNAFVAKLSADGSSLVWSTKLGGNGYDIVNSMAVDATGVYVGGVTASTTFPVVGTVFDPNFGGNTDGFVSKIALDGSSLIWSSYLGGASHEEVRGLAVDSIGAVHVTGETSSADFPTQSPFKGARDGNTDSFAAKIHPSGASLTWSTFLGGTGDDKGHALALDATGNVIVAGTTRSSGIGSWQGAIAKIAADGQSLAWSVTIGGSEPSNNEDIARGVVVTPDGSVVVCGGTASGDFPTTSGFDTTYLGSEGFVTRLNPASGAIVWSSFLGGSSADTAFAIAADSAGAVVVVGGTMSPDFPSAGWDATLGGDWDAFIAKINPATPAITWSTYLGGAYGPAQDDPAALALDASGNLYVVGSTWAAELATPGAYDTALGGNTDVFVSKINAGGGSVAWTTYLGGSTNEVANALAVDASGAVYVVGRTESSNFPTASPFDGTMNGAFDAFVAKLSPDGTALTWSSFLGGTATEEAFGVAVDGAGAVYVCGLAGSSDFPVPGGFDTTFDWQGEAFVVKIAGDGSGLVWGTFLGGNGGETARALLVDGAGSVIVAGRTDSDDFPLLNAFQTVPGTFYHDAFITKLAASGASLLWSSRLGGNHDEDVFDLTLGPDGAIFVAGMTTSYDFATPGAADTVTNGSSEGFVAKVAADGSARLWCSYLGGTSFEEARGVAVDSRGEVYVTGWSQSTDLDVRGGFDVTYKLSSDAFVARLNGDGAFDWMSRLGGRAEDRGVAIAVDASSNVFVLGRTASPDFPLAGAFDAALSDHDGFLVRIADLAPRVPRALVQTRMNGHAILDAGGWTNESSVLVKALLHDPAGGMLKLQVQRRLIGDAYDGVVDAETALMAAGSTASLPLTGLADGAEYHWRVRSVDSGGTPSAWAPFGMNLENPPNPTAARDVGVDLVAPSIDSATAVQFSADEALLSVNGSDNRGIRRIAWVNTAAGLGGIAGAGPSASVWAKIRNGNNPITVLVWDHAGNLTTQIVEVARTPSVAEPTVAVSSPLPGAVVGATPVAVTGTANAPWFLQDVLWINETTGARGTAAGQGAWSASVPLTSGANLLRIVARDPSNQTGTATITVTLAAGADAAPPAVAITSPGPGPAESATAAPALLGGTASDDVGISLVRWTNAGTGAKGVAAGGSPNWTASLALAPGANTIEATAVDPSGKESTASLAIGLTPESGDWIPPWIQVVSPGPTGPFGASEALLSLSGVAADDRGLAGIVWSNSETGESGGAEGLWGWTARVPLAAGVNTLTVTAWDERGNSSSTSILVTYTVPPGGGGGAGGGGGCGALGVEVFLVLLLLRRRRR